jgi:hypothetical protein
MGRAAFAVRFLSPHSSAQARILSLEARGSKGGGVVVSNGASGGNLGGAADGDLSAVGGFIFRVSGAFTCGPAPPCVGGVVAGRGLDAGLFCFEAGMAGRAARGVGFASCSARDAGALERHRPAMSAATAMAIGGCDLRATFIVSPRASAFARLCS